MTLNANNSEEEMKMNKINNKMLEVNKLMNNSNNYEKESLELLDLSNDGDTDFSRYLIDSMLGKLPIYHGDDWSFIDHDLILGRLEGINDEVGMLYHSTEEGGDDIDVAQCIHSIKSELNKIKKIQAFFTKYKIAFIESFGFEPNHEMSSYLLFDLI